MKRNNWLAFFAMLIVVGVVGAFTALVKGHSVYGITDYVPWGILISTYIFFVVTSTGLCLISSMGHVFNIEPYPLVAKRAVLLAIITLLAGFAVIGLELGNPLHFIWIMFTPNPASAIYWMGMMYSLYLVLMIAEFYFLIKEDHGLAKKVGFAAFGAAIIAHSILGSVFGFLHSRPFWEGPYLPIYFILSALVSGTAILIVMYFIKEKEEEIPSDIVPALSKLLVLFLGITIFFTIWKVLTGVYGHPHGKYEAFQVLFNGPLSLSYWIFEVGLGMVVPVAVLMFNRSRTAVFWVSATILVAIFFMRYNLIVAGQIVPLEIIDVAAPLRHLHTYQPSWVEISIVAGALGFTGFAYMLGEMKLDLGVKASQHDSVVKSV